MKIAMINGSPKSKNSASESLLGELKSCLTNGADVKNFHWNKPMVADGAVSECNECDVWVFAFPLYVDGLPSHLLACLRQIEKMGNTNSNTMIFAIVNCGFYEGKQCAIAVEILKNWCNKLGLQWGMAVGVGGGGGLGQMQSAPLGSGPKKSLGKAFAVLKQKIEAKTGGDDVYLSIDFPRWLYKIGAETGWKQMIRHNGGTAKDLGHRC